MTGPDEVFAEYFAGLSNKQAREVARWSLDHRRHTSDDTQEELNRAIATRVRVNGYREKSAPNAPVEALVGPVSSAAKMDGRVANAVFGVWWESQQELQDVYGAALRASVRDKARDEPENPTREEFEEHINGVADEVIESHPHFPEYQVRLVAFLSGQQIQMHYEGHILDNILAEEAIAEEALSDEEPKTTPAAKRLFAEFLTGLEALPADAPDWDAPLIRLFHQVNETRKRKAREFDAATRLAEIMGNLIEQHGQTLAFFEWNPEKRLINREGPWADPIALEDTIDKAGDYMIRFAKLRAMAPASTDREETEREEQRAELRGQIREALSRVEALAAAPAEALDTEPDSSEDVDPEVVQRLTQERDDYVRQTAELGSQLEAAQGNHAARDEKIGSLQGKIATLEQKVSDLNEGNSNLRGQIRELEESERATRQSYIEAKRAQGDGEEEPPVFDNVSSVLDYVESRWPDALCIALNSSSDRRVVFDHPNQLCAALEWLATTYRDAKMGVRSEPYLDVSLKAVCSGWDYVAHQSEVTMGRYRADYETTNEGIKYSLEPHIGRGISNSTDQIRVAFAWDSERQMVIVGYVGRHQRTDAS